MMGLSIAINVLALRPLTEVGRDELIDLIALLIQSATKESGDRQPRCPIVRTASSRRTPVARLASRCRTYPLWGPAPSRDAFALA